MKSVKTLALALAFGGLSATSVWADGGAYAPAAQPVAQSLMPLPDLSTNWAAQNRYPVVQTANYTPAPTLPQPTPAAESVTSAPSANSQDVYEATAGNAAPGYAAGGASGCASGNCAAPVSGDCAAMGCCQGPTWYGYVGGLIMTRNQPNKFWTTYNQANNNDQVLNTAQAEDKWAGGVEVRLGRTICCDGALEATYWGIWNMHGSASVSDAGNNLGTPLDTTNGGLTLGGQTADSFYANSHEALIYRNDNVNNVELNWYYNPHAADSCSCLQSSWLAGVRYFRFDEDLLWTSVAGGFNLNQDGGADQANLDEHCINNMVGFQVGNRLDWRISDCWSFYGLPKVGIYGNHATNEAKWYRGDGVQGFDLHGSSDTVSFIGQMDVGMTCQFGCHLSGTFGYRVLFVSGIALSDQQIPAFLAAANDFTDVKTNGDLILHGGFAGLEYRF